MSCVASDTYILGDFPKGIYTDCPYCAEIAQTCRRHGQGPPSSPISPHGDTMDGESLARRRSATDIDKGQLMQRISTDRSAPHPAPRHGRRGEDSGHGATERQGRREETERGDRQGDERDGNRMRRDAGRDEKREEARRGGAESGKQDETAQRGRTRAENEWNRNRKLISKTLPRKAFSGAGRRNMCICADYMDRAIHIYNLLVPCYSIGVEREQTPNERNPR